MSSGGSGAIPTEQEMALQLGPFFPGSEQVHKRKIAGLRGLRGNGSIACREQASCRTSSCFQASVSSAKGFAFRSWLFFKCTA